MAGTTYLVLGAIGSGVTDRTVINAYHPTESTLRDQAPEPPAEAPVELGEATVQDDGSLRIELTALPTSTVLVLQPKEG